MYAYSITVSNLITGMDDIHHGYICANNLGDAEEQLIELYNKTLIQDVHFKMFSGGDLGIIEQSEMERMNEWFRRMEQA